MKFVVPFLASFGLVGGLAATVPANAFERRLVGTVCAPGLSSASWTMANGAFNTGAVAASLSCPVIDDTSQQKHLITTMNLHGTDNNNTASVTAAACIALFNTPGGICGVSSTSGAAFTGEYTLSPARTQWTVANAAHFGYVSVVLPARPGGSGTESSLKGIYTFN